MTTLMLVLFSVYKLLMHVVNNIIALWLFGYILISIKLRLSIIVMIM